jgi:glucokinase
MKNDVLSIEGDIPLVLGIDLGGTKCSAALANPVTGELVSDRLTRIHQGNNFFTVLLEMIDRINEKIPYGSYISSIGIGCAGLIDTDAGEIIVSNNLNVRMFPLAKRVVEYAGVPCHVSNDVEAAALGELKFGAGLNCDDFVIAFIGTGIGARLVQEGKIRRGICGTAGELGQTLVRSLPPLNGGISRGQRYVTLESHCSRPGIARLILERLDSPGLRPATLNYTQIIELLGSRLTSEREAASSAIAETAEMLGVSLANVVNFLNPGMIILGGGAIERIDGYFEKIEVNARQHSLELPASNLKFVRAALGDNAGVLGAAMLASSL